MREKLIETYRLHTSYLVTICHFTVIVNKSCIYDDTWSYMINAPLLSLFVTIHSFTLESNEYALRRTQMVVWVVFFFLLSSVSFKLSNRWRWFHALQITSSYYTLVVSCLHARSLYSWYKVLFTLTEWIESLSSNKEEFVIVLASNEILPIQQ